jgi:hypothetical protein
MIQKYSTVDINKNSYILADTYCGVTQLKSRSLDGLRTLVPFRKYKCDYYIFPIINKDGNFDIIYKCKNKINKQWYYSPYRGYIIRYSLDEKNKPFLDLVILNKKSYRAVVDNFISKKYITTENGIIISRKSRFVCGLNRSTSGNRVNYNVHIKNENGFSSYKVHRLVAHAFCPRPEHLKDVPYDELDVNHIDGVPTNNHYTNLEWCTRAENIKHAYKIGLNSGVFGEKHGRSKHTNEEISFIRKDFYKSGKRISQYAKEKGFTVTGLIRILENTSRFDINYIPDFEYLKKIADARGSNSVLSKLSAEDVKWIRQHKGENIDTPYSYYSKKYNVSDGVIYYTLLNKKYVDPNYVPVIVNRSSKLN